MRRYYGLAALLGLAGFIVHELLAYAGGVYVSHPAETALAALAAVLGVLLSAALLRPLVAWGRGWRLVLIILPALLTVAVVVAVLEGLLFLMPVGRWPRADELISALFYPPVNALADYALSAGTGRWPQVIAPLALTALGVWALQRALPRRRAW